MFRKVNNTYFVKEPKDLYTIDSEDGKRSIVHSSYADDQISISTDDYVYPLPKLSFELLVEEINKFGFNIRIDTENFNLENLIVSNFYKKEWEHNDATNQYMLVKGGNSNQWELWDSYMNYWKVPNACYLGCYSEDKEGIIEILNEQNVSVKELEKVYFNLGWM